jgi:hypothetical protein
MPIVCTVCKAGSSSFEMGSRNDYEKNKNKKC